MKRLHKKIENYTREKNAFKKRVICLNTPTKACYASICAMCAIYLQPLNFCEMFLLLKESRSLNMRVLQVVVLMTRYVFLQGSSRNINGVP